MMPPRPFSTDGCSGLFMRAVHLYWRLSGQRDLSAAMTKLCEAHDAKYWRGGSALARVEADADLMVGVARLGRPMLARCMVTGIGIGGHPLVPRGWRWGYGWPWPHRYDRGL